MQFTKTVINECCVSINHYEKLQNSYPNAMKGKTILPWLPITNAELSEW